MQIFMQSKPVKMRLTAQICSAVSFFSHKHQKKETASSPGLILKRWTNALRLLHSSSQSDKECFCVRKKAAQT